MIIFPVVSFSLGEWDLRKGIILGQRDRVIRYLDKAFEDVSHQIREKQAKGMNVTQAVFLINLANFSMFLSLLCNFYCDFLSLSQLSCFDI